MTEEWRSVLGFEDYEVSCRGRIKSLERLDAAGHRRKERMLKLTPRKGHIIVRLFDGGVGDYFPVAHLVAEAFVAPRPGPDWEVVRLDCDTTNNRAENLQWRRMREREVLRPFTTDEEIAEMRALRETGLSYAKIGTKTGHPANHVWRVLTGKTNHCNQLHTD